MTALDSRFCTRCGQSHDDHDHTSCAAALALEPARYCPQCARRMIVQVTPGGWTARCSQHGVITEP